MIPAHRFAVGLYGLTADPTVRTTIAAANGNYDPDRIVKLQQLVESHSEDPMYRFLLAGLYKNGRYYQDAFQEYKRVLDAAPSTYQARINLGNIHFALGQYGEAITNYRKALEIRPESVLAYYDMYLAQSDSFKLKEASESLASARRLDPVLTNRLLESGSREGGGAKVVDAVIDFNSIWKATVEGRQLGEWLNGAPEKARLASALPAFANATSIVALVGFLACGVVLVVYRGRISARQCTRCGRPFCPRCKPTRDGHDYCSQCVHLFVLGDGLSPETKSMKLYEVERHDTWARRTRRAASVLLPGASHVLMGRAWVGCGLVDAVDARLARRLPARPRVAGARARHRRSPGRASPGHGSRRVRDRRAEPVRRSPGDRGLARGERPLLPHAEGMTWPSSGRSRISGSPTSCS